MFVKLTRSGPRTYVQLVESYRDDSGKPRQRTLATLGRADDPDGQVDALLNALLRAKGRSPGDYTSPQVRFESALALGDVWALDELWRELGFHRLTAIFRRARYTTPIEQALRVMVFNRLCDPESKHSGSCAGCRPCASPRSRPTGSRTSSCFAAWTH